LCFPLHPTDGGQVAKDCVTDDPFFNKFSIDDFSLLKMTVLQLFQGVLFLFPPRPVRRAWLGRITSLPLSLGTLSSPGGWSPWDG